MEGFTKTIIENSPKAFKYFEDCYSESFDSSKYPLASIPFEMTLGVFISFFTQINSDIELYSYEKEAMMDAVLEAFKTYEEYLFLDS